MLGPSYCPRRCKARRSGVGGVTAPSCGEHFHLLRNGPPPLQSSTPGGAPGLQRWLSFPACRPRLDGGCTGPSSGLQPTGPLPHTVIHQLLRAPAPPPRTRISACPSLQPRGDSGRYEWVRPSWREGPRASPGATRRRRRRWAAAAQSCARPRAPPLMLQLSARPCRSSAGVGVGLAERP